MSPLSPAQKTHPETRLEYYIRRVVFPFMGLLGIGYEAVLKDGSDPQLLLVYLALLGFGGTSWLRDAIIRRGGEK